MVWDLEISRLSLHYVGLQTRHGNEKQGLAIRTLRCIVHASVCGKITFVWAQSRIEFHFFASLFVMLEIKEMGECPDG